MEPALGIGRPQDIRGLFAEILQLRAGESQAGFTWDRPALFIADGFVEHPAGETIPSLPSRIPA